MTANWHICDSCSFSSLPFNTSYCTENDVRAARRSLLLRLPPCLHHLPCRFHLLLRRRLPPRLLLLKQHSLYRLRAFISSMSMHVLFFPNFLRSGSPSRARKPRSLRRRRRGWTPLSTTTSCRFQASALSGGIEIGMEAELRSISGTTLPSIHVPILPSTALKQRGLSCCHQIQKVFWCARSIDHQMTTSLPTWKWLFQKLTWGRSFISGVI